MTPTDLRHILIDIWQMYIPVTYREGTLVNAAMVQAEFFRCIQRIGFQDLQVWLAPKVRFLEQTATGVDGWERLYLKKWLETQNLGLVITHEDLVLVAMEVNFAPQGYQDHRRDVRRLISLAQLGGNEELILGIDPYTGLPDQMDTYLLHPDLLCVYAIINQQQARGLEFKTIKREYPPEHFPDSFLHLKGAIKADQAIFDYSQF